MPILLDKNEQEEQEEEKKVIQFQFQLNKKNCRHL